MSAPALLVLHDVGDGGAGTPWREAFTATGWSGPLFAPDLPGHGSTPAPVGGAYELADAALALVPMLREISDPFIAVGVGANGWAAHLLALADRTCGLVLVDGLSGPWRDAGESIAEGRRLLRAVYDDPAATSPAPHQGLDPRLAHGVLTHGSRRFAERAAESTPVPALLLETPASPVDLDDARALAGRFRRGAQVLAVPDRLPATVAVAVLEWHARLAAA